jgi:hypothetical protein
MFLSFAIYCLALNPEVQETLFAEVDRAFGSAKDKKLTYDEVNEMEYLDMFSSGKVVWCFRAALTLYKVSYILLGL